MKNQTPTQTSFNEKSLSVGAFLNYTKKKKSTTREQSFVLRDDTAVGRMAAFEAKATLLKAGLREAFLIMMAVKSGNLCTVGVVWRKTDNLTCESRRPTRNRQRAVTELVTPLLPFNTVGETSFRKGAGRPFNRVLPR